LPTDLVTCPPGAVSPLFQPQRIVMHNVWPQEQGGKEELAVEAVYNRA
jgi:hypothetical protein